MKTLLFFADLSYVLTGGEKISVSHINKLSNACPGLQIIHCYGPTENTTFSTYKYVEGTYQWDIPIGKPISNSSVYVLDKLLRPVPIGVQGEIYVGGDGVAMGYLNRPELTHEKFIQHPTMSVRLYRTGDFGYFRANGDLVFKGRNDDQVKIRGYRVELGEIAAQMAECKGINQSIVLAHTDDLHQKYLVGYYSGTQYNSVELKNLLRMRLPEYMIPVYLHHFPSFPLNANGKIDISQIPRIEEEEAQEGAMRVPPANKTEELILEIWKEVLGKENIGVMDNFFEIGGQSLRAMKILIRINRTFTHPIKINDIFTEPTIRGLAGILDRDKDLTSLDVQLNTETPGLRNIFMIPPILGIPTIYLDLASQLEGKFNCKGLAYKGAFNSYTPDEDMVAISRSLLTEVLKYPDRELIILGYSMGALVAFELTKLLERKGKKVKLMLLDKNADLAERDAALFGSLSPKEIDQAFQLTVERWPSQQDFEDEVLASLKKLYARNISILASHRLEGKLEADMTVIEAADSELPTRMQDWKKYTSGKFKHQYASGSHEAILSKENLPQLVKNLVEIMHIHA